MQAVRRRRDNARVVRAALPKSAKSGHSSGPRTLTGGGSVRMIQRYFRLFGMSLMLAMLAPLAVAADACKNRGELDTM